MVSLTSCIDGEGAILNDFDGSEADLDLSLFDEDYDTFSQEFRFVGEQWLVGVYYYLDDAYSDYQYTWYEDSLTGMFQDGAVDNGPIDIETTSWAVFGEYRFDFGDRNAVVRSRGALRLRDRG